MPRLMDALNLAYVHARPHTVDAHGIFYVGKGRLYRAKNVVRRNPYHRNIVNKYGKENILVGMLECSSEDIAFELEKGLIKCLKRMGVKLTNGTDGGDGPSGRVWSDEWKQRLSQIMKGKTSPAKGKAMPLEQRAKIAEALRGQPGRKHTEEVKTRCGKVNQGRFWITDGSSNKRVRVPMAIPENWTLGVARKKGKR